MQYLLAFLEGIITFVSPCLLPMLPLYVSYFAGSGEDARRTVKNAFGFIIGFTAVFVALGALAGSFGRLLREYKTWVDIITGAFVVFFGLNFLGIFKLNIFKGTSYRQKGELGFFSSILFGIVFSIGWTPCVGAFLGSALMLAANRGSTIQGVVMLFTYSLGLGIPFFVSALIIDKLKGAFDFIKRHYGIINICCGLLLVCIGILMATGTFGLFLGLFA